MDGTAPSDQPAWWVACLCAAWCGVCRDWQPFFTQQARAYAHLRFAWVDVEDEDDAMGDVDIETFPTLMVARGEQVMFLAPVPPLASQFARLLARLQAQRDPDPGVPAEADALLRRLKPQVFPRGIV
ncbi:thioredoxin family protein [Ramlibacter sp.]|uniref:thioredoxin family protein n=1 Tax=Ramlibacter sp. TaxID=1917967 RepID=UPI00262306F4|nr:thioredoxin family protein [Ramlibacter sp.]MDB5953961.1 thiol reductase thioredoxin [Ramlibacter sp.]